MAKRITFEPTTKKTKTADKPKAKSKKQYYYQAILGVGFVIALAFIAFFISRERKQDAQEIEAQEAMWHAQQYFEAGKNKKALHGDGINLGFIAINQRWGGDTKAGKLAAWYIGIIYIRQKKYQEALKVLNDVEFTDPTAQSQVFVNQGDVHSRLQAYDQAIACYEKAVALAPNHYIAPYVLLKLAHLYKAKNDIAKAKACYVRICEEFPKSPYYPQAQKEFGFLTGLHPTNK